MPRQKEPNTAPRKPRIGRTLAALVSVPLLLMVGACIVYWSDSRLPPLELPVPEIPPDNAYDDFVKAGQLALGMQHPTPSNTPNPNYASPTFALAVQDAQPVLAALRQGLNKPCQVPPERSQNLNYKLSGDGTLGNNAHFRNVARINHDCAIYEERTGHLDQAMEIRLDGMEMSVMLLHGANMIGMLTSGACEAIAIHKIEASLPSISTQELAHTADRLDKIAAMRPPYANILLEEGYSSTATYMEDFREEGKHNPLESLIGSGGDKAPTWEERRKILRHMFTSKEAILRQNLEYYKECAVEAQQPYVGPSKVPISNLLAQELEMDGSVVSKGRINYLNIKTAEDILRVEVALYRYKADHGTFPATLMELTPAYLKGMPSDPFGGEENVPLHYQVKEDGHSFLLYSLGQDLKDDGGQPQTRPNIELGDLVAGHLFNYNPIPH